MFQRIYNNTMKLAKFATNNYKKLIAGMFVLIILWFVLLFVAYGKYIIPVVKGINYERETRGGIMTFYCNDSEYEYIVQIPTYPGACSAYAEIKTKLKISERGKIDDTGELYDGWNVDISRKLPLFVLPMGSEKTYGVYCAKYEGKLNKLDNPIVREQWYVLNKDLEINNDEMSGLTPEIMLLLKEDKPSIKDAMDKAEEKWNSY